MAAGQDLCNLLAGPGSELVVTEHIDAMKMENAIRILAGSMVLTSLALAHWVSPNWLWLTAFVGANLFQSALTGFCPAELVLKKLGVGGSCCAAEKSKDSCCAE
jgi:hypothetical protein